MKEEEEEEEEATTLFYFPPSPHLLLLLLFDQACLCYGVVSFADRAFGNYYRSNDATYQCLALPPPPGAS